MKELAQTLLVCGGSIGLLVSIPLAAIGWYAHRGFSGDLTSNDYFVLFSPLICISAISAGVIWMKRQKKAPGNRTALIEDGGASGDAGGFD